MKWTPVMLGKTLIQKGGMFILSTSLHLWVAIETVRVKAHNPLIWCTIGCWSPIKWIKDTRLESIKLREESTEQELNRYFLYGNKAKAGKWDCAGLYSFYIGERMSMGVKWPTRAWRERLAKHTPDKKLLSIYRQCVQLRSQNQVRR